MANSSFVGGSTAFTASLPDFTTTIGSLAPTTGDDGATSTTLALSTSTSIFTATAPISTAIVTPSSIPPSTQIVTPTVVPTTNVFTSVVSVFTSGTPQLSTVVVTSTLPVSIFPTSTPAIASSATSSAATSTASPLNTNSNGNNSGGGLSSGGTVAIAVVIPVVVVALLVLFGIWFWRRRKQRKTAHEARRKEVEEYGYNPNDDPTLPAVVGVAGSDSPEMSEEPGPYRGWGNNTSSNGRKASTNLSSSGIGMAVSDDGRLRSPQQSDGANSGDPLMEGATGAGAGVTKYNTNGSQQGISSAAAGGIQRGPSNASSQYSAAGHTDNSEDVMAGQHQEHGYDNNYSQYTPYHPGAGGYAGASEEPVIRDVSARRNTKIENPSVRPQPGNSGISANF